VPSLVASTVVVPSLVASTVVVPGASVSVDTLVSEFEAKFVPRYKSESERSMRRDIFAANVHAMAELADKNPHATFTHLVNSMGGSDPR